MIENMASSLVEGLILFAVGGLFVLWITEKFCNSIRK